MSLNEKIKTTHLNRCAYVYVRQSTASQVQHNRESTDRQYKLTDRAVLLGWPQPQIRIIDEDLARSGSTTSDRNGFATMTTEVALGHVGLILSIEVSRVARNNADWYRLLDLCGVTDTLIGDEDGLYHPGLFNDRLLLGLKGTMAEAELHVIRARLEGGIRNKAARGQLRRGLPVGFVWGEQDGEVLLHPDQAVTEAIQSVFDKFTEMGSVRRVWLWFRSRNLVFPLQSNSFADIQWVTPTYTKIHHVLNNPVYAGAYVYGKTRQERFVDQSGRLKKRVRRVPRSQWQVLIQNHHKGFIDWNTYEMNQHRISNNAHPTTHQASGAIREGAALLQGIATCGRCGRRLRVYYQGRYSTPGYYCTANNLANGRGLHCMRVGGVQIDQAVCRAFLDTVAPAGIEAAVLAEKDFQADQQLSLKKWRLQVERAQYEVQRAERRYRAVEPENRLVARALEADWERSLSELSAAQVQLSRHQHQLQDRLTDEQRTRICTLGTDLMRVWEAPTTTDRDRKELFGTLLEEVNISIEPGQHNVHLVLRWKGGAISHIDLVLNRRNAPPIRTDEDTIELVRRLSIHHSDSVIAGIVNRQGRRTAHGERFTANKIGNLRRYWKIPRFDPTLTPNEGKLVTVQKAAEMLGLAPSTIHRWLSDGFIAGEQITPGAPWRIRITEELRSRFVEQPPEGYVTMLEAKNILGVSRQTVLQRVKRGELSAVHVRCGKQKGLRIKVLDNQLSLFNNPS
ncbi:MAG: recombinase family protein [Geobacteraceae bacterium]|nr:MAG: recombinase family protein [Geobacteraceae bacterium]